MSKHLLFAFGNVASARLQFILARRLADKWRVSFLCWSEQSEELARALPEMASVGAVTTLSDYLQAAAGLSLTLRARLVAALTGFMKSVKAFEPVHAAALGQAVSALRTIRPDALVVSEDGISSNLHLIAAARRLGIPVIDVPYGYGVRSDLDADLEVKAKSGNMLVAEGAEGRWLRLLAPQWIHKGKFAGAVMFPPAYILAAEAKGVTLRDAWTIHGGLADRLCAESAETLERYRAEGIPGPKCELTGSPYCDEMVEAVAVDPASRKVLNVPGPIEPGLLRILVSWPPSYHDRRGEHSEFGTYEDMTRSVLCFLRDLPGTRVTVSLHPACTEDTRALLTAEKIEVSDEYVIRLIPKHDVFVTYFSSTIRWAIAAGKPVVNYDAYRLGLDIYDRAGGFINVASFEAMRSKLGQLAMDPEQFKALAAAQCRAAARWGIMDGECCGRIASVIAGLVPARPAAVRTWRSDAADGP